MGQSILHWNKPEYALVKTKWEWSFIRIVFKGAQTCSLPGHNNTCLKSVLLNFGKRGSNIYKLQTLNSLFYLQLIPGLSAVWWLWKRSWEECGKGHSLPILRHYSAFVRGGVRKTMQKLSEKLGPKLRFKFIDFLNRSAKRLVVLRCFCVTPHGNCSYTESAITKAFKPKITLILSFQLTGCMSYKGIILFTSCLDMSLYRLKRQSLIIFRSKAPTVI